MAYIVADYWNALKYTVRGFGSFSDGVTTSHQMRDVEKALPDWWRSDSGPPIEAPSAPGLAQRPPLTERQNSEIDYHMRGLPSDADTAVRARSVRQAENEIPPAETAQQLRQKFEDSVGAAQPISRAKNGETSDSSEFNYSVGQSEFGFHYSSNELSVIGADREDHWDDAYHTLEEAEKVSKENVPWLPPVQFRAAENLSLTRADRERDDEDELGL